MTPEEKREYNRQYRAQGFGANADARYRAAHIDEVRQRVRECMRKRRREDGTTRKG